jgi:hypothetical protein
LHPPFAAPSYVTYNKLTVRSNGTKNDNGTPISPPTTPRKLEKVMAVMSVKKKAEEPAAQDTEVVWKGWDAAISTPASAAPPRRNNPNWPRGPKPPPKKTVWPKQSEMRAKPDESSDGGVSFVSNSGGDPDYDVKKLMDWNGDWLPPPEQWSARKGYSQRHFGKAMEQWMNGHGAECVEPVEISPSAFTEGGREIVPRYWVVDRMENKSMGEFWKEMSGRAPAPLSDCVLCADPPFWERYEDDTGFYIDALDVPEAKVDPVDPENSLAIADVLCSATERAESIAKRKRQILARSLAKQRRPIRESMAPAAVIEDRGIHPTSNVYFRPVNPADVRGIAVSCPRLIVSWMSPY